MSVRSVYRFFNPPRADDLTGLANHYRSDKGSVHLGAHNYARVYQRFFEPHRLRPIRFLEIGLLHPVDTSGTPTRAPSLNMWRKYFPQASLIGFDIKDFSKVCIPNCEIVRGDAGNPDDLKRLAALGPFDIIIDDASHTSEHQQMSLAYLFPSLRPGGMFVVEDLHWQPDEPKDSVKTRDVLRRYSETGRYESAFAPPDASSYLARSIEQISFFDSDDRNNADKSDALAIITKSSS